MKGRRELSLEVFTKLMRATNSLQDFLKHEVSLPAELLGSGFAILEVLLHKGPLCQSEIGQKILKTSGNISQALDKLEQRGLVQRTQGPDKRTYRIELTDLGRSMIVEAFDKMALGIQKSFSGLELNELEALGRLCKKLGLSLV